MNKNIKVVFMGTPEFSVPVLDMLINNTNVLMVVTQPDTYTGRKKVLTKSPVKLLAEAHNIPVFQPEKIRKDYEALKELDFDLLVTCAYGQILPKEILDMPKFGPINVHASLLPKYRGASPINFAIFNGEEKTGVTLMYMDEGMDTGDIIVQDSLEIDGNNYGELYKRLSTLGANLLFENLDYLVSGNVERHKQNDEEATYTTLIKREFEHIDFNDTGVNIVNKIKGLNPEPLANTIVNGLELKIVDAHFEEANVNEIGKIVEISKNQFKITCKDGYICLDIVKPFGKSIMIINSYINGLKKENIINTFVQ